MNDREKFLFDLNGYLVLEDVLTPAEVIAANAAVDCHADQISDREPGLSGGAAPLEGRTGRGEFRRNPLAFERPWCEPFRRMLTHPRAIEVFNEILGPGFRLDHGPGLIRMVRGTEGHQLHGGMTFDPSQYHRFDHGRMQCGLCVAAWQLTDVKAGDGGFACVPGSHKSNYRPARRWCVWRRTGVACVRSRPAPARWCSSTRPSSTERCPGSRPTGNAAPCCSSTPPGTCRVGPTPRRVPHGRSHRRRARPLRPAAAYRPHRARGPGSVARPLQLPAHQLHQRRRRR